MDLQILQKQLDESSHCPLCQASMFWIEAEQYSQEFQFHECIIANIVYLKVTAS